MRFNKITATLGVVALVGLGVTGTATLASATNDQTCTPSAGKDAYDETIVDHEAYDETIVDHAAYDETVVDSPAVNKWYSWTGGQSDTHPWPSDDWQVDNGQHNGFPQDAGVYERPKGNSDNSAWFYHEIKDEVSHVEHHDAVTHAVHHDAVTHVVHHDAVPAVTCDDPEPTVTETQPEPTPTETQPEPTPTITEDTTPHKVYVCKYVGTPGDDEALQTGQNPIEVDTHSIDGFDGTFPFAFNDAQTHSVAIGFVGEGYPVKTIEDCPAPQVATTHFITVLWHMDNYGETTDIFPQTYVKSKVTTEPDLGAFDADLTGTCTGFQVDVYKYTKDADKTVADNLITAAHLLGPNNPLEHLIPGGEGTAWKFYKNTNCQQPPQECTPSGDWYTEDIAPEVTDKGWLFSGPHAQAVDYYHPVSGNLQGLGAQSITYTDVSGYHPSLVFEIYRNGTTGYATIVAEPYLNGWSAGQDGIFTVTQSTLVWTSKITSGPGSQSQPIALSDMAALYPDNALISEGIHLGTNSSADQHATVTNLSGCASVSTVPTKPNPETVYDFDYDAICTSPADGTVTVTYYERQGERPYVWDSESHSYVLGDDESIVWGDWTSTTESYPDSECPPPPVPDTVTTEVSQPVCGDTTITTTTTTVSYTWEFQAEQSEFEGAGTWVKVAGEPVVTTSTRPITNEEIDALDCPLVPGGIQAQCVGNIPYLVYGVDLPAGFTADSSKPVTITFHKGSNTYTLPGTYPLSGKVLWPGANVSPAQWPGWTLDGTQPTDDPARFGWTREGVSVTFEVNPSYTTTVAYPEATSACANPPVVPPTPITPHHLASTGANMAGAGLAALVLIGLGSALTVARKRYGNQH